MKNYIFLFIFDKENNNQKIFSLKIITIGQMKKFPNITFLLIYKLSFLKKRIYSCLLLIERFKQRI